MTDANANDQRTDFRPAGAMTPPARGAGATVPLVSSDPLLLDFPDHFVTARLLVRAPRPGDGAVVLGSLLETLDDLRRFPASMLWAQQEQTLQSAESFCRRGAATWILRSDLPMLAFDRGNGEHICSAGLHRFDWPARRFEIGWWCRRRRQGQGFTTEAVRGLIDFSFAHLGAQRVFAYADEQNVRSWRVAERVGMQHEGTLRSERGDPDGTRRTMRLYAVVR